MRNNLQTSLLFSGEVASVSSGMGGDPARLGTWSYGDDGSAAQQPEGTEARHPQPSPSLPAQGSGRMGGFVLSGCRSVEISRVSLLQWSKDLCLFFFFCHYFAFCSFCDSSQYHGGKKDLLPWVLCELIVTVLQICVIALLSGRWIFFCWICQLCLPY